jgi:N-methylhydantoinase A
VIVPPYSGVFSAWGMLMADLRHDLSQTFIMPLDTADSETVNGAFRDLEERVRGVFAKENVGVDAITTTYQLDLRYVGQEHTLAVVAPAPFSDASKSRIAGDFDEQHLRIYGHNAPDEPKEIVSLKVIGLGSVTKPNLERIPEGGDTPTPDARLGGRDVYVGNGQYSTYDIYRRDRLQAENVIAGPAIIEEVTATTVIETGQSCRVDPYGNLLITRNGGGR